jgi:hypothetical protein
MRLKFRHLSANGGQREIGLSARRPETAGFYGGNQNCHRIQTIYFLSKALIGYSAARYVRGENDIVPLRSRVPSSVCKFFMNVSCH